VATAATAAEPNRRVIEPEVTRTFYVQLAEDDLT
jgi:hypothetical protein